MKKLSALIIFPIVLIFAFVSCVAPQTKTDHKQAQPQTSPEQTAPTQATTQVTNKTTIHVLNWTDYLDERIIRIFESSYPQYEIKCTMAESNEEMMELINQPDADFDLCILSDYAVDKLAKEGMLIELDKSKLPNLGNVDEGFLNRPFDLSNRFSVPYMWGTTGILYNKKLVNGTVDSWSVLWDERYAGSILMLDSVRDVFAVALVKLGYSMNSANAQEITEAEAELAAQMPLVQEYGAENANDRMMEGKAALALVYSGDALLCMECNPDLEYVIPKEGANIWIDSIVIPKTAKKLEGAYQFIDFLKCGFISQLNSEYIGYSTPDKAVLPFLPKKLIDNPVYNPPKDAMNRCEGFVYIGNATALYDDAWSRLFATN